MLEIFREKFWKKMFFEKIKFWRRSDVIKSRFLAIFVIFRVLFIFKASYSPLEIINRHNNIAYLVGNLTRIMIELLDLLWNLFLSE